jgi:hypothetical protein
MGKAIRASVLVLLLSCSVRADWMANGSPAPPPSSHAIEEPTADGVTGNDAPDDLTQTVLDLLAVLPSLF